MLKQYDTTQWDEKFTSTQQIDSASALEQGNILYFPQLAFTLAPEEQYFLSAEHADPRSKNISYHPLQHQLWGVQRLTDEQRLQLKAMLDRFSNFAQGFVQSLLPQYMKDICIARTSYRPVQISNRKTSFRKDDKRLHIDAFPSAPNQGKRILRVFCNVNPHGEDRVWRVGESFDKVVERFVPQIKKPLPGSAATLRFLKITKSYRTAYDHYMLNIHDRMKADDHYQQKAQQQEIRFVPGSTWIVQTDQVSHAAMQGQYVLEQTFYLPVKAMQDESRSPLRVLEKALSQSLV